MHQTLFHIPSDIGGIAVFGFGLLLAVWAVVALGVLAWLVRRQGFSADTWSYVPIFLIVGAVIAWLLPALCKEEGLPIRGYGTMMLVAVISATALAVWRARRVGQDSEMIFSLALWLFVFGIVGARAFYVIEYWPGQYLPVYQQLGFGSLAGAVVNVAEGGLVVYGGFAGGLLGLVLFVRKHRLPLWAVCDLIAPSVMLGLALGRMGCLLNGCCFGGACDCAWAVRFPPGSPVYCTQIAGGQLYGFTLGDDPAAAPPVVRWVDPDSPAGRAGLQPGDRLTNVSGQDVATLSSVYELLEDPEPTLEHLVLEIAGRPPARIPVARHSLPVHPTQIYSAVNALLIGLMLLVYDRFRRRDGELSALMITLYPITRFLLEMIRTDEAKNVFGTDMTISQNVSLAVLVGAAALWFHILRRPRRKTWG